MRSRRDYDLTISDFAAGESKVYGINWLGWLDGAQIVTADITVDPTGELTVTSTENTAHVQRFRLAGGEAGSTYRLTATIATDNGDTLKCSVVVVVEEP